MWSCNFFVKIKVLICFRPDQEGNDLELWNIHVIPHVQLAVPHMWHIISQISLILFKYWNTDLLLLLPPDQSRMPPPFQAPYKVYKEIDGARFGEYIYWKVHAFKHQILQNNYCLARTVHCSVKKRTQSAAYFVVVFFFFFNISFTWHS